MEAYLGTVCIFGFNYAPYGWQYCNGQILAISQNAALFSLLGTYYGGNGTSTFGLPNLQGRNSIHMGQLSGGSLYTIGEAAGVDNVTVLMSNMPAHNHGITFSLNASNGRNSSTNPQNNFPATSENGFMTFSDAGTGGSMKSPTITLGASGGSVPVTISDPSIVMNYCIAMQGIFPTRN